MSSIIKSKKFVKVIWIERTTRKTSGIFEVHPNFDIKNNQDKEDIMEMISCGEYEKISSKDYDLKEEIKSVEDYEE